MQFQFTGLIRGPTITVIYQGKPRDISIHRPHTRPDVRDNIFDQKYKISIHRPHTRPDFGSYFLPKKENIFQFTGLIRGPTVLISRFFVQQSISIHRPHTRPDISSPSAPQISFISIHRPHTRPDDKSVKGKYDGYLISIHRPHTRPDSTRS